MARKFIVLSARIFVALASAIAIIWLLVAQPTAHTNPKSIVTVNPDRLKSHVQVMTEDFHPRNWQRPDHLDKCAGYIRAKFEESGAQTSMQVFEYGSSNYRNVIARFGPENGSLLIIGAHYDSYDNTSGADDNASGVAVLIELADLLGKTDLNRPIELVAYTLEEPPFFRTDLMGSAVHAKSIHDAEIDVLGVLILEMVGFYSDRRFSQSYPSLILRLLYPSRGNYLGIVGKLDQGQWIRTVKNGMKGTTTLPVYSIRAPTLLPGIDYSDHLNYWAKGYDAVMLTDTAFYRNHNYHTPNDTLDKLDFDRMADVVVSAYEFVRKL